MRDSQSVDAERLLVSRCLAGDPIAWRALCDRQRPRLLQNLRRLLGCRSSRLRQIDDIIAELWSSLVVNHYARLRRYDPGRTALSSYLTALALRQMWTAERKHRSAAETAHALRGNERVLARPSDRPTELLIEELCSILPATYAELVRQLVGMGSSPVCSTSAAKQKKYRVRATVVRLADRL
jgi:hypothetical protein